MAEKKERIEDLPVESEQATEVKGGIIVQRSLIDPNDRNIVDPNNRSIIVQSPTP